jgi:hypothetical protein
MTIIEHLRTRFAIWRLEQRIEAAAESQAYHEMLAHTCMDIAERDRRILREARGSLERINTALSQGVPV